MEKFCPKCFGKFPAETDRCPADGSNLISPEERNLTGQVIDDRYTVLERIGHGGMGVVYKAEQQLIKRVIALKVLRREMVQDEIAVKRFLVEAQAIASLVNRFTVTLYDFGVTRDGLLYYTMELLRGQPLSKVMTNEGPLEYRRCARLVTQVCESLDEAHERGILHRDIKPENIFILRDRRGKETVKVLDFGIAKLVGDSSAESMTKTGSIVGTPTYMSPEQAMGNPVVPASDLYSLGIVLFEMLTGCPPFQAETPMKTLWAHIKDPMPSLQSKNCAVKVPVSIERFLARALEKDPGRRFQSAGAFRDALIRCLQDDNAFPETVSLPSLWTTNEGLRLKTSDWEAIQGEVRPLSAAPLKAENADPGQSDPNLEQVKEPKEARRILPAPPEAVALTEIPLVSAKAKAPVEEKREHPLAETLAFDLGGGVEPPSPLADVVEVAAFQRPSEDSDWGGGSLLEITAGRDAASSVAPSRSLLPWAMGSVVVVVLGLLLVLWSPWKRAAPETDIGQKETRVEAATVPMEAVATSGSAALVQPAALKTVLDEKVGSEATGAQAARVRDPKDTSVSPVAAAAGLIGKQAQGAADQTSEQVPMVKSATAEQAKAAATVEEAEAKLEAASPKAIQDANARNATEEAVRKATREAARNAAEQVEAKREAEELAKRAAQKAAKEAANRAVEKEAAAKKAAEEAERAKVAAQAQSDLEKARRLMSNGKYEEAITSFGIAKEQGAEVAEVDGLVRQCYDEIRKREAQSLVAEGNIAFEEMRWADCVRTFEMAAKLGALTSDTEKKLKKCRAMTAF